MPRHPNIVNASDLQWEQGGNGKRFAFQRKGFTLPSGGEKLGCSLFRVPPGKAAFPHHLHHANEEALYILAGKGTLRLDESEHSIAAGDYVALTAGGPAHQLLNSGEDDLEYLCISTMIAPEVAEYPDSGKLGAIAGSAPGGDKSRRRLGLFYKKAGDVDYYEGE